MPKENSIIAYLGQAEKNLPGNRRKRRARKQPRWLYPVGVETRYVTALVAMVNAVQAAARRYVLPNLARWLAESAAARGDSARNDAWYDEAARAVEQMKLSIATDAPFDSTRLTRNIANESDDFNKLQWVKIARAAVGVNILTDEPWIINTVEPFVKENTLLITNLATDQIDRIGETVMRGVRSGARHETIAKELFDEGLPGSVARSAKNRAKLIARDQVGKLNGQLTERRQADVGVDEYIWRTAGDLRVRGNPAGPSAKSRYSHFAREGKKFKWSEPPPDGHPGEAINCRCYAEPVFGDEFDSPEVRNAPQGRVK